MDFTFCVLWIDSLNISLEINLCIYFSYYTYLPAHYRKLYVHRKQIEYLNRRGPAKGQANDYDI